MRCDSRDGSSIALRVLLALSLIPILSGCATIRGSQDPLPELRPTSEAVSQETALTAIEKASDDDRGGLSKVAYRNKVIRLYSQRIEARYNSYVDQLYAGDRGTALGFDLLQLGLAGATALSPASAVDDLATVMVVTAGARASIDKRVFYDRTINALIASMDAERTLIKVEIARKRRLSESQYTLNDAFDDLNALNDAGKISRAFSRIARNAEADRSAAVARLSNISAACDDINFNDAALRRDFRVFVKQSDANATAAASAMSIDIPAGQPVVPVLLDAFANKYCGNAAKQELLDQLLPPSGGGH